MRESKRLEIKNLTKTFITKVGKVTAVKDVNLTIEPGEFVCLLGPSGCGKTTTLRMIAGFEIPTEGEILIGEKDVAHLTPDKRDISMVFQNYALFPHMNVYDNIAYGLRIKKKSPEEIKQRVARILELMKMEEFAQRVPSQMSGGQQQRVSLARALIMNSGVLLFDEPLSNLDAKLRVSMRVRITQLHHELKTTMIYVTHDQVEAMTMGDRITVLNAGKIMQVDSPLNLYHAPKNKFVAGFIGSPTMNIVDATLVEKDGKIYADIDGMELEIVGEKANKVRSHVGKKVAFGIRPESVEVVDNESSTAKPGEVLVVEQMGNEEFIYFTINGKQMTCRINVEGVADTTSRRGRQIFSFDTSRCHIFDAETEENISL